ncbi:MAG: rhomboid family intramembrane serine protease [Verrucomicrobia bacterium]|nr:MAG: rhomboid family intramembrane serine protease [Verrucomicrobiota bacterium]
MQSEPQVSRSHPHSSAGASLLSSLTPVVKWLIIANGGFYLLDVLLKGDGVNGPLRQWGAFAISTAFGEGRLYELLTFQFLQGSLGHLIMNCLGLFFFGPWMERWWGAGKFLLFYLLCGVAGAVFFSLLVWLGILPSDDQWLVGASAGIYGILIGVAVIAPSMRVALLFPPVVLSMRQLALALLGISVAAILLRFGGNEGGEAGHLGGAILGFLLTRFPQCLGKMGAAQSIKRRPIPDAKIRPRSELPQMNDQELDRILDKISAHGFQSLTTEERAHLQQFSNSNQATKHDG